MTSHLFKFLIAMSSVLFCTLIVFVGMSEWNNKSETTIERIFYWRNSSSDQFVLRPDILDQCIFAEYDAWDKELKKTLGDLNTSPIAKCDRTYKFLTELKNFALLSNDTNCQGRCAFSRGDWDILGGGWQPVGSRFECDIVQAKCAKDNVTYYSMLHAQISELKEEMLKTRPAKHKKEGEQFDVFVILLDSISPTQMIRVMPKTLSFLEKNMSAVSFPHLNKVGINSGPNGVALWFGYRPESIDRGLFRLPSLPSQMTYDDRCSKFMDNETFIIREYEDYGYKTMLAEDWLQGALQYPGCKGFKNQPTTHYMKPFQVMMEGSAKDPVLDKIRNKDHCVENHNTLLQYMGEFINSYKDSPKFGWLWLADLGHNYPMDPAHADGDFLAFLEKHKEKLDDAFTIFIADHGLRFGAVSRTKLGSIEANNPMFTMSIPRKLRNTKVMDMLNENRLKLQTHYDIRATFLDILKYQPATNYTDQKTIQIGIEYGNSILREQNGPRTCKTLPIPLDYCICQYPTKDLDTSDSKSIAIGKTSIQHINDILRQQNLTDLCVEHVFSKVTKVSAYLPEESLKMYAVRVEADAPSHAEFKLVVQSVGPMVFEVVSSAIDRLDSYGDNGKCAGERFKHLCFCKSSLKKSS